MAMKIGITRSSCQAVAGLLQLCQDAGYEAVELSLEGRDPDINLDEAGIRPSASAASRRASLVQALLLVIAGEFPVPTLNSGRGLVDHCQGLLDCSLAWRTTVLLHPGRVDATSYLETRQVHRRYT